MPLGDLTSSDAIRMAMREFDDRGRAQFLAHYGFRESKKYFLLSEGRSYDSKAIVAVAYGYQFPRRGVLKASQFSGGRSTVQRKLEALGFVVKVR